MEKREELYRGKAKSVYKTDDANRLILLFRNDTSAFDGKRIDTLGLKELQIRRIGDNQIQIEAPNMTGRSARRRRSSSN